MHAIAVVLSGALLSAAPVDVPLSLWTSPNHPNGLSFGGTMGLSFGDYDGDGFIDVFACYSGNLWRNASGTDWELVGNLSSALPPTERRYGSSFGDYDNDGRPDIAMAPRVPAWGDDRFHLLHRTTGGFTDVAADPAVLDVQPYGNTETLCWADVNGDRNLDLFIPAYPPWEGGPGNFFFLNEGSVGPQNDYRFRQAAEVSGLDNPPGTSRPEGAQFVDADGDGDLDLFSNGTLYRNASTAAQTKFEAQQASQSGIALSSSLDEGAMFFDYDLDGDFDLVAAYSIEGVRIWENRGDGTFFAAEPGIVDAPMSGLNLGMSAEDWDNDGDVDFTTRGVFRRNMLVEEGRRHFTVASTAIAPADLTSATPAWGDWDRDGDLDCALGNWGSEGRLYDNTLYGPATPPSGKRYLRVRAVGDSRSIARGLETEYGAVAEVHVSGDAFRRRKFVASSHGYLNQNEYALHFGLPQAGLVDVSVDFPDLSASGLWRVDRRVNPALAGIDPSSTVDREVTVFRCGRIVIDGVVRDPLPLATPRLSMAPRNFPFPSAGVTTSSTQQDRYVGLAFDTSNATQRLAVEEILLDAQLAAPGACTAGAWNLALWDVTDPAHPVSVAGGALARTTSSRNTRSAFPVDIELEPGRSYRLVAHVTESQPAPAAMPDTRDGITVRGGLSYSDPNSCSGLRAAAAAIDPTATALAFRFRPVVLDAQSDPLGASLRISRVSGDLPALSWTDVGAPGYRILRCSTADGPCTPETYSESSANEFTDSETPLPGEAFWYTVAVDPCATGP